MHIACRILERISCTHHYELWTGDQVVCLEYPIHTGFGNKVLVAIGQVPGQFPGRQLWLFQSDFHHQRPYRVGNPVPVLA